MPFKGSKKSDSNSADAELASNFGSEEYSSKFSSTEVAAECRGCHQIFIAETEAKAMANIPHKNGCGCDLSDVKTWIEFS